MTAHLLRHRLAPTQARADVVGQGLPLPALIALLLAVVVGLSGAAAWRATGGRWAVVETPSMGTAVPVGSLILTRPRALSELEVGDIITYRPPNFRSLYTHRVVEVRADGTLRVQGDSNGAADPWPVNQNMLIGQVVKHVRGLGWLLRAMPTVLLGLVVLLAATRWYAPPQWRSSARIIGTCIVLGVSSLILRPFVHPVLVATTVDGDGETLRATVASTGMLPTRVTGAPGQQVDLLSGQVGSVIIDPPAAGGPALLNGTVHLTGWWMLLVVFVCSLPLLWVLLVGVVVPAPQAAAAAAVRAVKPRADRARGAQHGKALSVIEQAMVEESEVGQVLARRTRL